MINKNLIPLYLIGLYPAALIVGTLISEIITISLAILFITECFKNKTNLNAWMVKNGYAVAYRKYSKKFISQEIEAKNDRLGLWRGIFEMPWEYRKKN